MNRRIYLLYKIHRSKYCKYSVISYKELCEIGITQIPFEMNITLENGGYLKIRVTCYLNKDKFIISK